MLEKHALRPLPEIFIDRALIDKRIQLYLENKHPLLSRALSSNGIEKLETRSIWYPREHVQTWLEEMDLMHADGMRIYFGSYTEEEEGPSGQLCLSMVLTRQSAHGNIQKDIILEKEPGFEGRKTAAKTREWIDSTASTGGKPRQYNYGAPCPPVCPPPPPPSGFEQE